MDRITCRNQNDGVRFKPEQSSHDKKYLTIADLKARLHVGNSTAYRLCRLRSFPAFCLSGRWLIDAEKLEEWLTKLQKHPDKGKHCLGDLLKR